MDSEVTILGRRTQIVLSERKRAKHCGDVLYVPSSFRQQDLREYLNNRLKHVLQVEYSNLSKQNGFFVIGGLQFDVVGRFKDPLVLSTLKESKVRVREDVIGLQRIDIREIVVHELAHIISKHHNEKFQRAMHYVGGNQSRLPIQM